MAAQKNVRGVHKGAITVTQIAARAQVSIGTVSHVLNKSANVRDKLRLRVEKAIADLGYQPSQLARGLRRSTTDLIGMIIPDIMNPFFTSIVRGAEDIAYKQGFRLVLCNTDNDSHKEITYLNDLNSFRPAGLLVIPSEQSELPEYLSQSNANAVLVDRCPDTWMGDIVRADNEGGGYQAGRHLLDMGHRVIAAIGGPHRLSSARDRMMGFQRALHEARLKMPADRIEECPFTAESGLICAMRLLQAKTRPTAIFAANDLLASGVLSAMHRLKLRCPEDVSLIGFDDLDFARMTKPALTTIRQPAYQMGSTACQILLSRDPSQQKRQVITLEATLKMRDSVQVIASAHSRPK
ncbi:MAG TPA: LacI family DNA-binding transcriptional regulator [Acidobacteriaceae bacterium]